jgi:hypothetical protein
MSYLQRINTSRDILAQTCQKIEFLKTWPGEKGLSTNRRCDVKEVTKIFHNMCLKQNNMPSRCVVYGCSNLPDPEKGISLHKIPFYNDSRPEAIKRRKVWVDFVKSKRAKWEPGSGSHICSKHFKADAFDRILNLPGQENTYRQKLKKDDLGIASFPSIFRTDATEKQVSGRAARAIKRKVSKYL